MPVVALFKSDPVGNSLSVNKGLNAVTGAIFTHHRQAVNIMKIG